MTTWKMTEMPSEITAIGFEHFVGRKFSWFLNTNERAAGTCVGVMVQAAARPIVWLVINEESGYYETMQLAECKLEE